MEHVLSAPSLNRGDVPGLFVAEDPLFVQAGLLGDHVFAAARRLPCLERATSPVGAAVVCLVSERQLPVSRRIAVLLDIRVVDGPLHIHAGDELFGELGCIDLLLLHHLLDIGAGLLDIFLSRTRISATAELGTILLLELLRAIITVFALCNKVSLQPLIHVARGASLLLLINGCGE